MDYYSSACLFKRESNHEIMIEQDGLGDFSSDSISSSSESDSSQEESVSAAAVLSSSSSSDHLPREPLNDMSSLLQQLPIKRGLSKHYQGKSQSFTSLSSVRILEDLQKPENPYNTKLKSVKSYCGDAFFLNSFTENNQVQNQNPPTKNKITFFSSRPQIPRSKQASNRGTSCISQANNNSTAMSTNHNIFGKNPPIPPPHRSTGSNGMSGRPPLFA